MQAIVLAGGLGSRLRAIVADRPKALASILHRPFLDYQLNFLRQQGIDWVVLCIGYLGQQIIDHVGDGANFGVRVHYAIEREQLGTGGAIRNAVELLEMDDCFLVMNGDTFLDWHQTDLWHRHSASKAAVTLLLTSNPDSSTGSVLLNEHGKITRFNEKVAIEKDQSNAYASAGVYLINRSVVEKWPTKFLSLEYDCMPELVDTGKAYGEIIDSVFYDIGTPVGLQRFEEAVVDGKVTIKF